METSLIVSALKSKSSMAAKSTSNFVAPTTKETIVNGRNYSGQIQNGSNAAPAQVNSSTTDLAESVSGYNATTGLKLKSSSFVKSLESSEETDGYTDSRTADSSSRQSLEFGISCDRISESQRSCSSYPTTPTSAFPICVLEPEVGNAGGISGALLAGWDNIMGPCVQHLWSLPMPPIVGQFNSDSGSGKDMDGRSIDGMAGLHSKEALQPKVLDLNYTMLRFIAAHTLSGEMGRDPDDPRIDTKLYIASDRGIAVTTLVFGAVGTRMGSGNIVQSLSVIVPYTNITGFMTWKDVCMEWLHRAVHVLRVWLEKDPVQAYDSLKSDFTDLVQTIHCITVNRVPLQIPLMDTALHPGHLFDSSFLRKAIVAHLYQCQQSIVIGPSAGRVNLMIALLSMFVNVSLRHRCTFVHHNDSNSSGSQYAVVYRPELCVQGFVIEGAGASVREVVPELFQDIYNSLRPTALIDIGQSKVWTLCPSNVYKERRHKFITEELQRLWMDSPRSLRRFEDMFESMDYAESIVTTLVHHLDLLPLTHGAREAYVQQYMSHLQRRAFAVIQLVEMKTDCGATSLTTSQLLSLIRKTFAIHYSSDIMIILSLADQLKPGFIDYVFGNSLTLMGPS